MAKSSTAKANPHSTEHHFFYNRRLWAGGNKNSCWFRNCWFCRMYLPEHIHKKIHLALPDGVPLPDDKLLIDARKQLEAFMREPGLKFTEVEKRRNLPASDRLTYLIILFSEAPETARALQAQLDIVAPPKSHKGPHR